MNAIGTSYGNEFIELPPLLNFCFLVLSQGSFVLHTHDPEETELESSLHVPWGQSQWGGFCFDMQFAVVKLEVKGPVGQQWDSVDKAKGKIYFFNTVWTFRAKHTIAFSIVWENFWLETENVWCGKRKLLIYLLNILNVL